MNIDRQWYLDVNRLARHCTWAHAVLAAYALWAGLVALVLIVAAAWWRGRYRADAPRHTARMFLAGLGAVVALILNQQLFSKAIARTRPCHAISHVETLLSCANDYSMPSDHAIIAGALAAGLLITSRRLGLVATVLALLLAFSRVYVGVHYPADVAAGLLIGALIGIAISILTAPMTKLADRLCQTPLRPLIDATAQTKPALPPAAEPLAARDTADPVESVNNRSQPHGFS